MIFALVKKNIQTSLELLIRALYILLLMICSYSAIAINDCYYQHRIINGNSIQIVTVNPTKHKIINVSAMQINQNTASVTQLAKKYSALVAINGGFFREVKHYLYVPTGALKIDNNWQGIAHNPRGSIGWCTNSNMVLIDRIDTKSSIKIGSNYLPISHFNPTIIPNQYSVIIYSNFHPYFNSLLETKHNKFLIKQPYNNDYICDLYDATLTNSFAEKDLNNIEINIKVFPQLDPSSKDMWEQVEYITSGSPVLIKNNQIVSDYHNEKVSNNFLYQPSPRTAVCITQDKMWKFIKTDKLSIPKLTTIMQTLECSDAINLDGGSSSALYLSAQVSSRYVMQPISNPTTDAILVLQQ